MTIYTIGHSNHPSDKFIDLLKDAGIELVIDTRSSPYSKYAEWFNKELLDNELKKYGITYVFMGKSLGGRPADNKFYDQDSRVRYDLVAKSEIFLEGIEELKKLADGKNIALMCGEENPAGCHRRLLIGKVLQKQGIEILHIRADGSIQTEDDVINEEQAKQGHRDQISLFADEDTTEWKSIPSVLPKKVQNSSSQY